MSWIYFSQGFSQGISHFRVSTDEAMAVMEPQDRHICMLHFLLTLQWKLTRKKSKWLQVRNWGTAYFFCRLGRGSTGQNLWVFAPSLVFLVQDLAMHSDVVAARLKDTDDDVCYEAGANTHDSWPQSQENLVDVGCNPIPNIKSPKKGTLKWIDPRLNQDFVWVNWIMGNLTGSIHIFLKTRFACRFSLLLW